MQLVSLDPTEPATAADIDRLNAVVDAWLAEQLADNPSVVAVQRDPDGDRGRWMVRLEGEDKASFTVWFDFRQRTLHAETHLIPAPLEPPGPLYEYLLRANSTLRGVGICIGAEDAAYVACELPLAWVDHAQLDRILGSLYEATERLYRPAMRLAFGDRFQS